MKQSYNSYEEINRHLEILKIEREISFHRLMQSTSSISKSLTAPNLIKMGLGTIGTTISSSLGQSKQLKVFLFTTVLKFLIRKLFKRK
ncbi:hypothetical protein EG240_08655 [Paenimyroides tangerinum]|uniref:Uncharacterized protein n=1 Tax=Paenimyroides tangerinum TaxID=2488728 RepID=A0A3P3W8C2_9FLAO|nr:DUF6327 family protein [Paenimyroides tangerinum]RRJ90587.1 hypothetical protein EG240_08655 [Paenimyroides tangerinum]